MTLLYEWTSWDLPVLAVNVVLAVDVGKNDLYHFSRRSAVKIEEIDAVSGGLCTCIMYVFRLSVVVVFGTVGRARPLLALAAVEGRGFERRKKKSVKNARVMFGI